MTSCKTYTADFISRFVDNQVSSLDHENFVRHMRCCRACAETESRFRQIDQIFRDHASAQAHIIRQTLPPIPPRHGPARSGKLMLKLASLGTAAIIFALALAPWTQDPEPSAIVNSVDTYGSSVMIIDTLETRHTIIWFSET